jgi:glyoxylase-like metal-dependent hydrolase (beta-lactamase superfamily II)
MTAAPIVYPFADEPKTGDGSAIMASPGVFWLRMPLLPSLPFINIWALEDEKGWSVVDTGMQSDATKAAWHAAFDGFMQNDPVVRVIATHMHADHCGMAGWLAERFNVRLWMSRLEYLTCRLMRTDTGQPAPSDAIDFYCSAGWDVDAIERYKAKFGSFGNMIYPLPVAYRRLSEGDLLTIGAHQWRVVIGNGHSPEHVCLYCSESQLFISGDQVLPKISSNVSVQPIEPDANPLGDWLTSLAKIAATVPDDVLVLPAHRSPFRGLHFRVAELIEGHERGLARLEDLLSSSKRVVDVFDSLFSRPIGAESLSMATGEAFAHLNYLKAAARVTRDRDASGVWWWRRSA